ncbi:MAG: alpha-L-fucosidase [Lachnospiraceae bacterium]|nr:alpha-L-fucosidase [uncultured Acetatifactor sp.]MCI9218298.1 alpha-L-fucosidase [Lachnospiraceae bacterium]
MYDMTKYLNTIEEVIAGGPYQDTWESLSRYNVPEWYRNAKFGIFIHWGIYSVPAFGSEWYSRNMYVKDSPEYKHHLETYGKHTEFGYKDFIPMFTADKFDPDAWAELFARAGAKYVVPVAEHHDGFQMYESEISHWNAAEMGPRRDVLGQLKESCRKKGMEIGASSHRVEHWFFMGHGREYDSDVREPMERGDFYWPAMPEQNHHDLYSEPMPTEEFLQDWLVRCCEIVDKYRPRIVYFDWWIQHSAVRPYLRKFAAYYYNRAARWGSDAVINYKHDAFLFGTAVPDVERGQFADIKPYFWQTDTAIALNSWGYTEHNNFRPAQDILCDLVDIVSKNGCLLLNVGPKPDGTITREDRAVLLKIGEWLKINGEAIYDSRVWRKYGEGPTQVTDGQFSDGIKKNFTSRDFRFTTAGGYLYAFAMKCSESGEYCIRSLGIQDASRQANFHGIIRNAEVLGCNEKPRWSRDQEGLHISSGFVSDSPVVFRLELE